MKKFDIITEADARVLEHGTSADLARGGHITPLAMSMRDPNKIRRLAKIRDLEKK